MEWINKANKKYIILVAVFIILLSVFFLRNKYYLPAELVVETKASNTTEATLYWDTGAGFNKRESMSFIPTAVGEFKDEVHTVEITRLSEFNPSSDGSEVWIENIITNNDENYDLSLLTEPDKAFINENNKLALQTASTTIAFNKKFRNLDIVFYSHRWAGKVQVKIDGVQQLIDLYSPDTQAKKVAFNAGALPNSVEQKFQLPQVKIEALKITYPDNSVTIQSISVHSADGKYPIEEPTESDIHSVVFSHLELNTSKFSLLLFIVQLLLAFIITYVINLIWTYLSRNRQGSWREQFAVIFLKEQRLFFWITFICSIALFSLWLVGQWPGVMTVDSYHFTWREIKTLEFLDVTPWVYNIYVLMLTQIYDSPVIVPLFQIFATSLLSSLFFWYCYRNGSRKWIVGLCCFLFVTSIPVGIYNITLWKDIPFNTIMLFWGFVVFYLYYSKKYQGKSISLTIDKIILLSVSLILLCKLRHNGIIFVVGIPLIIVLFRLLTKKNIYQFVAATISFFIIYSVVTPIVSNVDSAQVSSFFSKTYRVGPLAAIVTSPDYYSPSPVEDKQLIDKWMSQEELDRYYTPVSQADTAGYMVSKWQALSLEDAKKLDDLFYKSSIQNLHLYFSDRIAMFMGTMGFSSGVFTITNELNNAEFDRSFWRPIEAYQYTRETKSETLKNLTDKLSSKHGIFVKGVPLSALIFNTLPALLVLLAALLLYKWVPVTALYSFLFLFNLPFLFIALSTAEWRYLYFLLLSAFFVLPLVSLERRTVKSLRINKLVMDDKQ